MSLRGQIIVNNEIIPIFDSHLTRTKNNCTNKTIILHPATLTKGQSVYLLIIRFEPSIKKRWLFINILKRYLRELQGSFCEIIKKKKKKGTLSAKCIQSKNSGSFEPRCSQDNTFRAFAGCERRRAGKKYIAECLETDKVVYA